MRLPPPRPDAVPEATVLSVSGHTIPKPTKMNSVREIVKVRPLARQRFVSCVVPVLPVVVLGLELRLELPYMADWPLERRLLCLARAVYRVHHAGRHPCAGLRWRGKHGGLEPGRSP